MYLVPVVQCGRLSAGLHGRQHAQPCSKSTCAEATHNGREAPGHVVYATVVHEAPQAAAAGALRSQPTSRTATLPWLRQIAVLVRGSEQQRLPSIVARCSPGDSSSVGVLTAPPASSTWAPTGLDGPDPLVIHLPGADGTSETSPADAASGGLPSTPTVVSDSRSLAVREPAAVQHSQQGQLGFRPGNGSRTLPSMMSPQRPGVLASGAVSEAPATAAPERGDLQVKLPGPLGFLSSKHWGSNSSGMYWGSPIGGTLFINPPVEEVVGAPHTPQQVQQTSSTTQHSKGSSGMYWGSPIGGTLFINPPVHDAPVCQTTAAAVTAGGAVSAPNNVGPCAAASAKHSKLPFLPPFQWGGPSNVHWGPPIGGTLHINPQAPADWHDGASGSGGSGFGSSNGGGSGGNGRSHGRSPGAGSCGSSGGPPGTKSSSSSLWGGGVAGKQPSVAYVRAGLGGVPLGVGLARLGLALMAATAAAAVAVYLKGTPSSKSSSSTDIATVQDRCSNTSGGGSGSSAVTPSAAAVVGPAPAGATEGRGFHQWMVARLQSTLESFEAEQSMLRTELAVLNSLPAGSGSTNLGMLGGLKRWLGRNSGDRSSSSLDGTPVVLSEAAATAAAVSGGVTCELTASDVMIRVSELQEQLDSIDVLKAALSAELAEQQQLLQTAQQEQHSTQEQLAALAGR